MLSKISLALSVVLLCLVIFLFVKLDRLTPEEAKKGEKEIQMEMPANSAFGDSNNVQTPVIAYINGDTIMARYQFFLDKKSAIELKMKSSEGKLKARMAEAQKEYEELMTYAQTQGELLQQDEAATIQDRIMELEYEMQDMQAKEERSLYEREAETNKELMKRIQDFLTGYTQEHHIDMVLNYQQLAQVILYAGQPFDITADVVNGLNTEYEAEKTSIEKK
ncbi:MAG: OmpH family outer membrane protein [Flavobacteriales bacterium]|nr:OmpH family outer membrane protein [Flavobacteriales bacterium]